MSYKKRKKKENTISQLNSFIRLIKVVLFKKCYKLKQKRRSKMQQVITRNLLSWLRQEARSIRQNNKKIDEWVESYIDECILYGKPVEILTQWCLSKDLEKRYNLQGRRFEPLKTELDLFNFQIPRIIKVFKNNNVRINWFITFNDSYVEMGIVKEDISNKYIQMIKELADDVDELLLINWEKDILNSRAKPNQDVLNNFDLLVSKQAYDIAMLDLIERTKSLPDFNLIKKDFDLGLRLKIACEAEEGRYLLEEATSLFNEAGKFILLPLELPERYVFFNTLKPDFQKRIVSLLKPYPWRLS